MNYGFNFLFFFVQDFIESIVINSLITLAGMISHEINSIYLTFTAASDLAMKFIRFSALDALGESY